MHTRDYKQHGAPGSRVELHNAVHAHNNVLGGGIVAVPAMVVKTGGKGDGRVVEGRRRDHEIVSALKMLTLR